MQQQQLKEKAAQHALQWVKEGMTLGIGSGSTVLCFIKALKESRLYFKDIVAASEISSQALREAGFQVSDLNACDVPDLYVDGADEVDADFNLIKGGGAALTREKIIASSAKRFVCIVDESKWVKRLGAFPLPVEVIPMARSYVARELVKLGGQPEWRQGVVTDNGNWILDVHGLSFHEIKALDDAINGIAGVVCHGIFHQVRPHLLITSYADGRVENKNRGAWD